MQITENMLHSEDEQEVNEAMTKCQRKLDNVCRGSFCKNSGKCFKAPNAIHQYYMDNFKKFDKRIDALDNQILALKKDVSDLENEVTKLNEFLVI